MKIRSIETLFCNAGWRPWIFIKVVTDSDLVGYSEVTDSNSSPRGLQGVVRDLEPLLVGKDPRQVQKHSADLYRATRQSPGGLIQKAIGGIENALLDIKAKSLGIPVYELFGGPTRDTIPLYWSHCGTTRVRAANHVSKKPITSLSDVAEFCHEIKVSGYQAIKTNILLLDGFESPQVYMPGFRSVFGPPDRNPDKKILSTIDRYIKTLRENLGEEIGICLDLNFNFTREGNRLISQMLKPYNLLWLELDCFDHASLRDISTTSPIPVCSGENLFTLRQFRPYLEQRSMDIVSIDVIWNGFIESKKIADFSETCELNVTPHNYYSHLATHISAQFAACTTNLRMMEVDVDDVPWREELVTQVPEIKAGTLYLSKAPGWGADLNESVIKKHPWQ